MTKIYNGTPHAINVVKNATYNSSIRKHTGGQIVLSIPSNGMLNAKVNTIEARGINDEVPVFVKSFSGVDELPEGYDIYIVSAMYASAAARNGVNMSKVYTVADPVYTEDGNSFMGCRGICPAF
jgi:hypothetical protein